MTWMRTLCAALALCGRALSVPVAGDFEAKHQLAVSANPSGLHFTIALRDGKKSFRIGERITLDYNFAADVSGKYVAGGSLKDQLGRSMLEQFVVNHPEDVADPVHGFFDLYSVLYCTTTMNPSIPNQPLGPSSPASQSVSLTEYLRFKPGHYRIYAVTRQVALPDAKVSYARRKDLRPSVDDPSLFRPVPGFDGPSVASENVVEFDIRNQDKAGANEEVEQIVARTKSSSTQWLSASDAVRLFEIGTAKARQAAAQLYPSNPENFTLQNMPYAAFAALLESPDLSETIQLMRQRLFDPGIPPDHEIFLGLPILEMLEKAPQLTADQIRGGGQVQGDRWRTVMMNYVLAEYQVLMAGLDRRSPANRALTIRFLHQNLEGTGHRACSVPVPIPAEEMAKLKSMHLDVVEDLPAREQTYDLQGIRSWANGLPKERLLPLLVRLFDKLKPDADTGRIAILSEVVRFDPELAGKMFRRRVIDFGWMPELSNSISQFWFDSFSSPELDEYFAKVFARVHTDEMERLAPLVARFGTVRILPDLKQIYEVQGAKWPCSMRAGLLNYFLRVDSTYGIAQTKIALEQSYSEMSSQCRNGGLLQAMALLRSLPELETLADTALSDSRPLIAEAGVRALGAMLYRDLPYRRFLDRLHQLHDEWPDYQSHTNDLAYMSRWKSGYDQLESTLVRYLTNSTSAGLTPLQEEALSACITDECRVKVNARLRNAVPARRFSNR